MNKLEVRDYDRHYRFYTDWVTEYILTSDKSLSLDEFKKILQEAKTEIYGNIKFIKKQLTYKSGKIQYRHICEAVMY